MAAFADSNDIPQRTGVTSKTSVRDSQVLTDRIMQFDLTVEEAQLRKEPTRERSGHTAKTLLVHEDLRVVMISLTKGDSIREHKAKGPVTIQVCSGRITLDVEGRAIDLKAGSLLALDRAIEHNVTAIEDSAILLTIVLS